MRSTPFWIALGVSLMSACSGSDLVLPGGERPAASGIVVVNGNGQTGQVGERLEFPLEVEVTDVAGDPVPDATVVFEITSAGQGANISPSSTTTNGAGRAEAQMLLGDKVGLQTGAAHVLVEGERGSSAPFSAFADPPPPDPDNRPPDADYNWHCEELDCQFTDASDDPDGDVTAWAWDFGDGGTSNDAEPFHRYPGPGTYEVTLVVTDNDGATDESTAHVDVDD